LLIDAFGWRWVFFIAVPFGLLGTLLAWIVLPTSKPTMDERAAHDAQERFDWLGAILLGPSVALVLLALTFANDWGWTSPVFFAVSMCAAASLGLFLAAERRAASALVDMRLFCSRTFSVGIVAGLLSYSVLFGSLFLVPFYLERVLGRTPAEAGVLLTPVPLALAVMAPLAGLLTDRFGSRLPMVSGMLLAAVSLVGLAMVSGETLWPMLLLLGGLGIGLGLFTPPNNSAIMGSAPPNRLGVAGGILNMTRSLGTSFGVAVTGALLAALLSARMGEQIESTLLVAPAVLQAAAHQTILFLAALAGVAGLLSAVRGAAVEETVQTQRAAAIESIGL
jgi:MFS family permease